MILCVCFEGGAPTLVVVSPSAVSSVLNHSVEHSLGGLEPASKAFFGEKVLFVLAGREWKELRQLMKNCFLPSSLPLLADDIFTAAQASSYQLCFALLTCGCVSGGVGECLEALLRKRQGGRFTPSSEHVPYESDWESRLGA